VADHKAALLRTFAISALCSVAYYVGIRLRPHLPEHRPRLQRGHRPAARHSSRRRGHRRLPNRRLAVRPPRPTTCPHRTRRRVRLSIDRPIRDPGPRQVILVLIAALLTVIAGGLTAVAASAIPEQFRTASRFTGLAIGGTVATTGWVIALGILIASVALATIPAIRRSPETAARHQTHS